MKVERRALPVAPPPNEYVITLSAEEAQRLHRMFKDAWWDNSLAQELQSHLEGACSDSLRRFW